VRPRSRLFQIDRAGPQLLVRQHGAAVTYIRDDQLPL
jgi:hypothetical protein